MSVFIDRKRASDFIDNILQHWVGAVFGLIKSIVTDNGGEFSSDVMREECGILMLK